MAQVDDVAVEAAKKEGTVLVVDDSPENLMLLGELLQDQYQVKVVNSGKLALQVVQRTPKPDIILLDINMPEMDGYEVLSRLKSEPETQSIPVIFITGLTESESEQKGLELGAIDYITKPFSPAIVEQRVRNHLELKRARDRLAKENAWLDAEVQRRIRQNLLVQDLTIRALAGLGETRDQETGRHILRTQLYVGVLVDQLHEHPDFTALKQKDYAQRVVKSAPLHDIGKVGIPDSILRKPGRLTPEEYEIMKEHAQIGADAIGDAIRVATEAADPSMAELAEAAFQHLRVAQEICQTHHEKWDGSGYPRGLKGDEIPISGRLMALADVFDALINRRVYKEAMPLDETIALIVDGRGAHFDPRVVDAFLARKDEFVKISRELADSEEDRN